MNTTQSSSATSDSESVTSRTRFEQRLTDSSYYSQLTETPSNPILHSDEQFEQYASFLTEFVKGKARRVFGTRFCMACFGFSNPVKPKSRDQTHGLTGYLTLAKLTGRLETDSPKRAELFKSYLIKNLKEELIDYNYIHLSPGGKIIRLKAFVFELGKCRENPEPGIPSAVPKARPHQVSIGPYSFFQFLGSRVACEVKSQTDLLTNEQLIEINKEQHAKELIQKKDNYKGQLAARHEGLKTIRALANEIFK